MYRQEMKILASSEGHGKGVYRTKQILLIACVIILLFFELFFISNYKHIPRRMESAGVFCIIIFALYIFIGCFNIWFCSYKSKSYISVYEKGVFGVVLPGLRRNAISIDINIEQISNVSSDKNTVIINSNGIEYKFLAPGNDEQIIKNEILKMLN